MSEVGQTETSGRIRAKSVPPLTTDMSRLRWHVCLVPTSDIALAKRFAHGRMFSITLTAGCGALFLHPIWPGGRIERLDQPKTGGELLDSPGFEVPPQM